MRRSFTERILGGVCGGLAASLRLNVWLLRALFVLLSLLSLGAVALWYVVLWWVMPPDSPSEQRSVHFSPLAFFSIFIPVALTAAVWFARDNLPPNVFATGILAFVAFVFFLRQLRG
jgi:phage shock protein PspC (stress-responsive transcriptional regulator)